MPAKHIVIGQPVHTSERDALQFLAHALPSHWTVYSNIDVPSGRTHGGTYEHDAIVVAPHAVFSIEIKGYAGRVTGNRDRWTLAGSGAVVTSPISLLLSKTRALKGWLAGNDALLSGVRVEGLVFLSAEDAVADLSGDFGNLVVCRRDLARVLLDTSWVHGVALHGATRAWIERRLNDGQPPRPRPIPGFALQQQLDAEYHGYELWLAKDELTSAQRLLHIHLIEGRQAEQNRRMRAAQREAMVYEKLKGAAGVLGYYGHVGDDRGATQRYALAFEDTTPLLPLPTWLAEHKPGMQTRLEVAQKIASALAEVHGRKVIHRRLHPGAILVQPSAAPERVVLTDFETAKDATGQAPTVTTRALIQPAHLCGAPELITRGTANERSDLFSLGALLLHLLTDRPLFRTVDEVLRPFDIPQVVLDGLAYAPLAQGIVQELLQPDPQQRPVSARGVADRLAVAAQGGERQPELLEQDAVVDGRYRLEKELGTGGTAQTWLAVDMRLQCKVVLKVLYAEHHETAERERQVLTQVQHPNLVVLTDSVPFVGRTALVLAYADGIGADLQVEAGDPLTLKQFQCIAEGLVGALAALHAGGWLHRDVKPQNLVLRDVDNTCTPVLLDVGLAARNGCETDLAVGTLRYKDPLVYRSRWSVASDLFAAALVLYELATGTHAYGTDIPDFSLQPSLDSRLLPQTWPAAVAQRLLDWLAPALSGDAEQRPLSADQWLAALRKALADAPRQPAIPVAQPIWPPLARPETWLTDLARLHKRALGAAARLGVRTLGQLATLETKEADHLSGVGVVALGQLRQLIRAAQEQWPDLQTERRDLDPLCRELVGDQQPLESVDDLLSADARDLLLDAGIHTIGVLAQLPRGGLQDLARLDPAMVDKTARRLRRMAGVESLPASAQELIAAVQADVGSGWEALDQRFGLLGGEGTDAVELAQVLGLQVAGLSDAMGLLALRAPTSAGPALLRLVDDALPPLGLAAEADAAQALELRLPGLVAGAALGWVRLSQVLRQQAHVADPMGNGWVGIEPWSEARLGTLRATLASAASWPPAARSHVLQALDAALDSSLRQFLLAQGLDAGAVLDALMQLDQRPCLTAAGSLYTPPVALEPALTWLRAQGESLFNQPRLPAEILQALDLQLCGLVDGDFAKAAAAAGLQRDGEHWFDPERVLMASAESAVLVDPGIRREKRQLGRLPATVQYLADAIDSGGVRVVCTRPAQHRMLGVQLVEWLEEAVGPARVHRVDVEAVLLAALQHDPKKWQLIPAFEAAKRPTWKWIEPECRQALEAALADSVPGVVTVLTDTALLGTLDLLPWLQTLYERGRGGRQGLLVLVVPGGVLNQRVRLNESYPFPYTPDMAAVLLEAS
jgi:serine/threonine protein kinase